MTDHDTIREVFVGVDTHKHTHHAAVCDRLGRPLADREFPTNTAGYAALAAWARSFGQVNAFGVEGTGSYGAGLTRALSAAGLVVVEVNRPDRATRRAKGKSDSLDAYAAARTAAAGTATGTPKTGDGIVEAIRCLHVAYRSAVKARTQCINQIHALLVTAPANLRQQMSHLSTLTMVTTLSRLRPGTDLTGPATATRYALRSLARRYLALRTEINDLNHALSDLTTQAAPDLLARPGVGTHVAAQLLVTAGDNPERLHSEASFAHLTGTAPIPASSGQRHRHRLNRGGDRSANHALHVIALSRMRHDTRTQAYVQRRTTEGLTKKDIIRCLKRAIAREMYHLLRPHPQHQDTPTTTAA